jgi:alkylation response protein AidB-like acyl-CoA dehydrogenase
MTPDEYLERVRALLPTLRERALHAEQLRRLPDETFKDFQEAGLFRCLQPRRYGGYELDPGTFYQAIMDIGTACGSSAWILGVVGVHNWHLPGAHGQRRTGRRRVPSARSLVVLQRLRLLPVGCAGRYRAAAQ